MKMMPRQNYGKILLGFDGLRIDGRPNVFRFEKNIQQFAASFVAERALSVLEIGYGLGFASQIFRTAKLQKHKVIEANSRVARRAIFFDGLPEETVIVSRWQSYIRREVVDEFDAIYFDAFPSSGYENYNTSTFQFYIAEFLDQLASRSDFRGLIVFLAPHSEAFVPRATSNYVLSPVRTFATPAAPKGWFSRISVWKAQRQKNGLAPRISAKYNLEL